MFSVTAASQASEEISRKGIGWKSLIAASALQYDLVVVTRNVKDFQATGLQVINPF